MPDRPVGMEVVVINPHSNFYGKKGILTAVGENLGMYDVDFGNGEALTFHTNELREYRK